MNDSDARFRAIAKNGFDLICELDAAGRFTYVSPGYEAALGYTQGELLGRPSFDMMEEEDRPLLQAGFEQLAAGDEPVRTEIRCRHRNGELRWLESTARTYRADDGDLRVVVISRDISDRKVMEGALRDAEVRYRLLWEASADGVVLLDADGSIEWVNPSLMQLFGYSSEELLGRQLRVLQPDRLREDPRRDLWPLSISIDSGGRRKIDGVGLRHDGSEFPIEATICDTAMSARRCFAGFIRDVSEQQRVEAMLRMALESERERARHDPLTGALNHFAVTEAIGELCRRGARFAVAMVDVDGMKAANDTYGHQVGDRVLSAVAQALSRDGADAGRYGGDEFVVILRDADRDGAEAYRDAVVRALSEQVICDPANQVRVPVSVSIGVACHPDEARSLEDLVALADSSMYAARRERWAAQGVEDGERRPEYERAAVVLGDIVPLLVAAASRDEKLQKVASQLSVGYGYDAVNFELVGDRTHHDDWERTYVRASAEIVDAWMREQSQTTDHALTRELDRTRRPIFLDDIASDERLTPTERELIAAAGLRSGLVIPMVWQDRLVGMLSVCSKRGVGFTTWDAQFLTTVAAQVTAIVFMTTLVDELQTASTELMRAHSDTVVMLAAAAEAHDHTTGRHLQRVQSLTESLARELGYNEGQARQLGLAAVLHDIGKIRVPDSVLTSPNKLDDREWAVMRQHTLWGGEFLDGRPGFELAAMVARAHHERWDGDGYPLGLTGEAIPQAAQITAVADSFDAMTNDRPYRAGRPVADAVREIVSCSGTQFSPRVVDALVRLHKRGGLPFSYVADRERPAA